MKNRASSHLLALFLIAVFQVLGYMAVYEAALLRGYEPSLTRIGRDLFLYVPLLFLVLWLSRRFKYAGNWTLYTTAVLLFSIGMLVQFRLYSDPEYNSRNKAEARAQKTQVQRLRYVKQNYDDEKKKLLGLPTDPQQLEAVLDTETRRQSSYTVGQALTSSATWIPLLAFFAFGLAFWLCLRDDFLSFVQRHSFIIVLLTLVPLVAAVVTSSGGKALGNMTPWEPSKIPFLL
ncbi:MAG: hypothetical protein LC742_11620, partial [Acidobacteria bacterium]|nr:hypothetical protein [Acidobacteriota bacterium]